MDAKVDIRELLPEDEGAFVEDEIQDVLDEYQVQTDYRLNDHKVRMPIASDRAFVSSVFVQTALPEAQVVIDWVAAKTGGKPLLPTPYLNNDTNLVYLDGTIKADDAQPDSDGTAAKVRFVGQYIYGVRKRNGMILRPAVPPWADPQIGAQLSLTQDDFVHGILDSFIDQGQLNPDFGAIK